MTQESEKPSLNDLPQVYDTSFKEWVSQQPSTILPLLLPGARYEATLDVEAILPVMSMDKAFKILYHGKEYLLDLEFQVKSDTKLKSRLLVYNAVLYHKHHLPVITIVVHPFRVAKAVSPLHIPKILTFRFKVLALFELNAEDFVRRRHTCMYPLLPAMENVRLELMDQALQELVELYQNDQATLSQHIIRLKLLLERTGTVTDLERERIRGRLSMFDQLFEESPMIQEIRQQSLEKGEMRALQRTLVSLIRVKYPDLAEFAQQQASHIDSLGALELLIQKVVTAPDANAIRWLLESGTQQ